MSDKPSLSYKDAGVNIDAGNSLVENIKSVAKRTRRPGVMGGLGGFGGLFEIPQGFNQPVLVSGTDGVGTKLRLAIDAGQHDSVGIDLVAMCVNDIIVAGAEPLYFLDYYATGHLDVEVATAVVTGIGRGCELAGCALIGGETAEMPGMYDGDDYDLAGFAVGIVEKTKILDPVNVRSGDILLGLPSSGPHSNGYSLIRKVLAHTHSALTDKLDDKTLCEHLLAPTRIYVKPILSLLQTVNVHALSHITGGGLLENIPRVLPSSAKAVLQREHWPQPAIFDWLQQGGNISAEEMARTFNCGIGMVICVAEADAPAAIEHLQALHETVYTIGHIAERTGTEAPVELQ